MEAVNRTKEKKMSHRRIAVDSCDDDETTWFISICNIFVFLFKSENRKGNKKDKKKGQQEIKKENKKINKQTNKKNTPQSTRFTSKKPILALSWNGGGGEVKTTNKW